MIDSKIICRTLGLPPERLKLLREAFAKMFKDPEFVEELKKATGKWNPSAVKSCKTSPRKWSTSRPMSPRR